MTSILRAALKDAGSLYEVAKSTGLQQASLWRFMRGEQSLRLDLADRLANYFGVECRRVRSRRKG